MFIRVAENIASAEARLRRGRGGCRGGGRGLLRPDDVARLPAELADAHERRPRAPAALGVLRAAGRATRWSRSSARCATRRSSTSPAAAPASASRGCVPPATRSLDAGRLVGPGLVHARVQPGDRGGQAGRHAPRRQHGRAARRPSGHPRLHQVQGRRRLRQLQHLGRASPSGSWRPCATARATSCSTRATASVGGIARRARGLRPHRRDGVGDGRPRHHLHRPHEPGQSDAGSSARSSRRTRAASSRCCRTRRATSARSTSRASSTQREDGPGVDWDRLGGRRASRACASSTTSST